jgi:hypothetical protein
MNCVNHPEVSATAFCRECGKALCPSCVRQAAGTIYCEEHQPAAQTAAGPAGSPPYTAPPQPGTPWTAATPPKPAAPDSGVSPGLAFVLGLIPGVGAIYNAQYAKGLIHVVIWGLLISIINSDATGGMEPLFGMLIAAWIFYMAFEAYHTAKKRQCGMPVDEFSSLLPMKGRGAGFPIAPIVLIGLGTVFLLNNLEILRLYQLLRYWPVFLIALGVYMLYCRVSGGSDAPQVNREAADERQ